MAKRLIIFFFASVLVLVSSYELFAQSNKVALWRRTNNGVVMLKAGFLGSIIPNMGAGIILGITPEKEFYIATAKHLVKKTSDADWINVEFYFQQDRYYKARIIKASADYDLAILLVDGSAMPDRYLNEIPLNINRNLRGISQGFKVFHIGYPGEKWNRNIVAGGVTEMGTVNITFQSSFISPGCSGGGLYDKCGNLIGMVIDDQVGSSSALSLGIILEEMKHHNYPISFTAVSNCGEKNLCSLKITTNPIGAEVFIGSTLVGTTPATIPNLNVGEEYYLRLEKPDYEIYSQKITCSHNNLNIKLERKKIQITSNPSGARVYIDGSRIGLTPTKYPKPLSGERKEIKFKKKYFEIFVGSISSSTGEIHEALIPKTGNITVTFSSPTCGLWDVKIQIGEHRFSSMGNPYRIRGVPLGEQDIEIRGKLTYPNGWCNAICDDTITFENGASYLISWSGSGCSLNFTRAQ